MDRVFDTFMRDPWGALSDRLNGQRSLFPMLDISENDHEVTVRAEVPGVDPKDLQITVTGNRLELAGEKKESKERQEADSFHRETHHGSFRRVVELPSGVDPQQITAEQSNGIVTIRLKKSQAAASRRIPITSS
jgi:HSP20 family protein